jgi:hypothetical protein
LPCSFDTDFLVRTVEHIAEIHGHSLLYEHIEARVRAAQHSPQLAQTLIAMRLIAAL